MITHFMEVDLRQCRSVTKFAELMRESSEREDRRLKYRSFRGTLGVEETIKEKQENVHRNTLNNEVKIEQSKKGVAKKRRDVKFHYTTSSSESESDVEALPGSSKRMKDTNSGGERVGTNGKKKREMTSRIES